MNENMDFEVKDVEYAEDDKNVVSDVKFAESDSVIEVNELIQEKVETFSDDEDLEDLEADEDDDEVPGVFTYKLRTPIKFEGELVESIDFDFDKLPSNASIKATKEANAIMRKKGGKKKTMLVPETDKIYLSCIAAMAGSVSYDLINSLMLKDYTTITLKAQAFLLQD